MKQYLSILFFWFIFLATSFAQTDFYISFPVTSYHNSNLYNGWETKIFKSTDVFYKTIYLPSFEAGIYYKNWYAGLGYQYFTRVLRDERNILELPLYEPIYLHYDYLFIKLGYQHNIAKNSSIRGGLINAFFLDAGTTYLIAASYSEALYDGDQFKTYKPGLELSFTQNIFKGLQLQVENQFFLKHGFKEETLSPDKNFTFLNTSLRVGYRF